MVRRPYRTRARRLDSLPVRKAIADGDHDKARRLRAQHLTRLMRPADDGEACEVIHLGRRGTVTP